MAGGAQSVKAGCLTMGPAASVCAMTEPDKSKEDRLAAALRDNLRRRKAQAREVEPAPAKDD